MITLNDYLYDGDTIFRILQKYIDDLKKSAKENQNEIDRIHSHFLIQIRELLEHNDFYNYTYDELEGLGHEWKFWDIELQKFLDYAGLPVVK